MIVFEQLTYTYPNAPRPVLHAVTCTIPAGSFTVVVGSSGAGKSTLVRCINGLVPHFSGGVVRGRVRVADQDPVLVGPEQLSQLVGCVFQDPESQAVMDTVEDEIAFALEQRGMPRSEMRVRVEETLDLLDLAALRTRRLETLSGGERQRVAIAAALALRPQILVLDEPTSQLDPQSAEDVLQVLVRLNSDLGLTIVLVEHRLERVLPFADQLIFVGTDGHVLAGAPVDILSQIDLAPPLITLAKALGWQPLPLTTKEGLRFSRHIVLPVVPEPTPAPALQPYLQVDRVSVGYGRQAVLRNLSFGVGRGEVVALFGRNGAGKSTLLRSMIGLMPLQQGRITVAGRDTAGQDVAAIARLVGYLPQDPNALLYADTVTEELQITLRNHAISDATELPRIAALLARLGLTRHAQSYPRDLSVGERQRVALGAIMIAAPTALLLDEPTRGLDYAARQTLAAILREWRREGKAMLVVTHDVEFAAEIADRVLLLGRGELIADGSPQQVIASSPLFAPQIARLFPNTGWLTARQALHALQPTDPAQTS
ncbi:MAG: ATP-binding cassette domain-containing protein [Roseiflexaceae bacterium]